MQTVSLGDSLHEILKSVSLGDYLHEMSKSVFWEKQKTILEQADGEPSHIRARAIAYPSAHQNSSSPHP